MDLSGYALDQPVPQRQLAGKVMTGLLACAILFIFFVAFRNNWNLSLADLPRQIGVAFSSRAGDNLPEEVEGLEATVKTRRTLIGNDKRSFLVVQGEVFNNAVTQRSHIVLRGRLIDGKGEVRQEIRAPCGKILDDAEMKAAAKGTIKEMYRPGGQMLNCGIRPDDNVAYQLVFEDIPVDYSPAFEVEVEPVSAQHPNS